jgi:regulator of replication initiation timing
MTLHKKFAAVAGLAVLALGLTGTGLWSYLRTAGQRAVSAVKENVPIDFEIERARSMVGNLVPEIRKTMQIIAQEEVEAERLAGQVRQAERKLAQDRELVLTLKTDLEAGRPKYEYGGRTYTAQQLRQDLAAKFARFQVAEENVRTLAGMLQAREQRLSATRQKLDTMVATKQQLEIQVEHLGVRLRQIEVAQAAGDVRLDATRVSEARTLIDEIQTRLEVAERVLHAEAAQFGEITVDPPAVDIVQQVEAYFGRAKAAE